MMNLQLYQFLILNLVLMRMTENFCSELFHYQIKTEVDVDIKVVLTDGTATGGMDFGDS